MPDALFERVMALLGEPLPRKPPFMLCRRDATGPLISALSPRELFFEVPS